MFENIDLKKFVIGSDLKIEVLESGNIYDIFHKNIRIKLLHANNYEENPFNIFIRLEKDQKIYCGRLMGIGSNSAFSVTDNKIYYRGNFEGLDYWVVITSIENTFFTEVFLEPLKNAKVNLFYGLDFAISDRFAVRNNESYVCQYVDHQVFKDSNGYVLCSRQNQGINSYLEQGSLSKTVGYCTDGFQFFGKSYKLTNEIEALKYNRLPSEIYQYEFAYCGLQTEQFDLSEKRNLVFYGSYLEKIEGVVKGPILKDTVLALYKSIETKNFDVNFEMKLQLNISFQEVFYSPEITREELNKFYPERQLEEMNRDDVLSFFTENHAYVVIPKKELLMERPSGNLLISGNHFDLEEVLSTTVYLFGVFNSQIVCGNTSFNKLLSNIRNSLNLQRITGQRIFIELNGTYRLLNIPLIYENGLNYAKWIYRLEDDYLEIKTYISESDSKLKTEVYSHNQKIYKFLVTNHITMSQNEHEVPFQFKQEDSVITFYPSEHSMMKRYPDITFQIKMDSAFQLSDDRIFFSDQLPRNENIMTMEIEDSHFSMTILGNTFGKSKNFEMSDFCETSRKYIGQFTELLNSFEVSIDNREKEKVHSLNHLVYWYTHDALVHYTSPHGLEQYNGAAWGTRDVCQGPAEYFMSTLHFEETRNIILEVFKHQFLENGDWPQWFMFDRFYNISQHESHGDIIVWPARLLGLYLNSTNDLSILKEKVPYMSMHSNEFTSEEFTIQEHLEREIESIEKNFIPNTFLSSYGGGDWDDTLQPAHKEYANNMVSGWTVALTYEMFRLLEKALQNAHPDLSDKYASIAEKILQDYNKYLIIDGVPAGFILFEGDKIRPIIHPSDVETGLKYRLLPLNRGIISELFSEEQKNKAIQIIDRYLKYPDGVRLMDKTVPYRGGVNSYFQRAETAANFGREVSLQYCHAHIRFCEALAKINCGELYQNLMKINPIVMHDTVRNSMPRQRNSYFSSSDGNFKTRYEAMENFYELKDGSVQVKSGWRVYSSGPGIYIFQLIHNLVGIKVSGKNLVLDPVLSEELNGLKVQMKIFGKKIYFNYEKSAHNNMDILVDGQKIKYSLIQNKYKRPSLSISFGELKDESTVTIYY